MTELKIFTRIINQVPQIENNNPSPAKVSSRRENPPYICGLRARIECEPLSEHSTRSDRVTNIRWILSSGASPSPARKLLLKNA